MKRLILTALAVTMLGAGLAACNGPPSPVFGKPAPHPAIQWHEVSTLGWGSPIEWFQSHRNVCAPGAQRPGVFGNPTGSPNPFCSTWYLNWTTDSCSGLYSVWGDIYGFSPSCRRHDFNYRNLGLLRDRFPTILWIGENQRAIADEMFRTDMKNHCNDEFGGFFEAAVRWFCHGEADYLYGIIRWVGRLP